MFLGYLIIFLYLALAHKRSERMGYRILEMEYAF